MDAGWLNQQNACLKTTRAEHLTSTSARQMSNWQLELRVKMRTRHPGTMQAMLTFCCLDNCVGFSSMVQEEGVQQ